MNERYRLLRKAAIEAPGPHTSIRDLPLDKAYPSLHDIEAQSDFYKRLNDLEIEVGLEANTGFPRDRILHIMYLDHAMCRKSNVATYSYSKINLEYKIKTMKFKEFKKYGPAFSLFQKPCERCWGRFVEYHKVRSGLFHACPRERSFESMFYKRR